MLSTSRKSRMTVVDPKAIQLYSAATPNGTDILCCFQHSPSFSAGLKVAIMLEELSDLRSLKEDFKYEPHTVHIRALENRRPEFLELCPNGKIPALRDPSGPNGEEVTVWESGSIILYLAEKYNELIPVDPVKRIETINWLFWASTGLSQNAKAFGFYYKYCPHKISYTQNRHMKECARLLEVLENQFKKHGKNWVVGDAYTIADVAAWPWVYALLNNYDDAVQTAFDGFNDYQLVMQWYRRCLNRPAVQRALDVTPFSM
jgi:GST-like protein